MIRELRKTEYKAGYIVKTLEFSGEDCKDPKKEKQVITSAYNKNGDYIGVSVFAKKLCSDLGITPELALPTHKVCSIGFSDKFQAWFGWSNVAIHGFQIGDEVTAGDLTTQSGWTDKYLRKHPEMDRRLPVGFKAKTLEDCKRMALAFADAVG